MSRESVLAIVMSFNGLEKTINTVMALLPQVDFIVIVDNGSDRKSIEILNELKQYEKVSFVMLAENMGVGYALNLGVKVAKERHCNWLLTMDQDSLVHVDMLSAYWGFIKQHPERKCLCPNIIYDEKTPVLSDQTLEFAITSGNLVRVELFDEVGLFNEKLFVDSVDLDFSLRVRLAGFDIWRVQNAMLNHELGDEGEQPRYLSKYYSSHSPLRRYYMYRNHLYIIRMYLAKYPLFVLKATAYQLIHLIMLMIYGPKRRSSMKHIISGVCDFLLGRTGSYSNRK